MRETDEGTADGSTNGERSTGDDQRGPWLLALGALAIGVLAFLATGARALLRRLRRD